MVNWMSENTNHPCIFQNQMVTVRTVNLWSVIVLILGWTEINETEITVELPPCGQKSICVCVCVCEADLRTSIWAYFNYAQSVQ